MVPTLTCGLVRSNFFFAIFPSLVPPFVPESPPRGSNPRPRPYQGRALPTELGGRFAHLDIKKRLLSATPLAPDQEQVYARLGARRRSLLFWGERRLRRGIGLVADRRDHRVGV